MKEFFPEIQGCKIFFPALYVMKEIIFQSRNFFVMKVRDFFPRNQSPGYSFLKSPIPPSKVKSSTTKLVMSCFGCHLIGLKNGARTPVKPAV